MAGGRFAPGHIGELTRIVSFDVVDAALVETGTGQRRLRDLPSRVVVYLLLAGALFAELGYPQVWTRMTAGLHGLDVADPTAGALAKARRRIGVAPLRALFDLLRGPAAGLSVQGAHSRRSVPIARRCADRRAGDAHVRAGEHGVERGGEFAVPVADQESEPVGVFT